jgi:[acyl-carrier-protein] S-malonyltransferase
VHRVTPRFAFVFPGQGSQSVGMGADVAEQSPAARATFDEADEALGFPLSDLCFNGPEERLRETVNTQPAIVATSLALLAALDEAAETARIALSPAFLAGHSVGEYTALAASGGCGTTEALRLVRERGRLMHEEGLRIPSGMTAVLGLDAPTLEDICAEATRETEIALGDAAYVHPGAGKVVVANDNAPGQIVISGAQRPLALAGDMAKARGATRIIPLAVSGAFHSPVMAPASEAMAAVLTTATLADPTVPLIANSTAGPLTTAADLRKELSRQIASPVRWTTTIEYLVDRGVTLFVEVGPGQVLAGLIRRINKDARTVSVGSYAEIEPALEALAKLIRDERGES